MANVHGKDDTEGGLSDLPRKYHFGRDNLVSKLETFHIAVGLETTVPREARPVRLLSSSAGWLRGRACLERCRGRPTNGFSDKRTANMGRW